ncbi:MAG TPA: DUF6470 family protein [Cerasibacillus sp.]|uniref:DUF6470 family protein n=1 Tax=Cerasibacillus sp. TaxID=2498711 RepID=UPI002F41B2C8
MKLPQIQIKTEMAQIDIRQTPGQQTIRQPSADMSIEQPKAELRIDTTPGKLTIDQTQAWEDMQLISPLRMTEIAAEVGNSSVLEGIARRAEQGQQLMKIEQQVSPMVEQAITNSGETYTSPQITFIPSVFAVKVDYEPGELNILSKENKPQMTVQIRQPEHHYTPGKVEVALKRYESIKFAVSHLYSEVN